MKIPDETLMAFADDELDAASRADVEAAMRDDPSIARRVAEHRALRSRVQRAYAQELGEMPPERLIAAARGVATGRGVAPVVSLDAARAAATRTRSAAANRSLWRTGATIAATLALGIGLGAVVIRPANPVMFSRSGALVANAALAKALSERLANADGPADIVHVGSSFVDKSGEYCRTFSLTTTQAAAGLACRRGKEWQIQAWAEASEGAAPGATQNYQTASSPLPPELVKAVEERIAGEPLDQAGEAAALRQGWQGARP